MNVDIFGDGPALVLVPGLACDGRMWGPVIDNLKRNYKIIVPHCWKFQTIPECADAIAHELEIIGVSKTFIAGLSMGGYVVFEFLRRHEGTVKAACLIDTTAFPDDEARLKKRDQIVGLIDSGKYDEVLKTFAKSVIWDGGANCEPASEILIKMASDIGAQGYKRSVIAVKNRGGYEDVLKSSKTPMLFMAGDHDALTPAELALDMADKAQNGYFGEVWGAGHMTPLENPKMVADYMEEMFARFLTPSPAPA